jgi:hypothetical protein
MRCVRRIVLGMLLLSVAKLAVASTEPTAPVTLAATSRIYVTLVPRTADDDDTRLLDSTPQMRSGLNLTLRTTRRNRLEFSLLRRDVLAEGDKLQLRMASDAHIVAQLLSGGAFSEADDSWIAVLGLASRFRLSYTNGPFELSISAKRKFGDGDLKARLTYGFRF